MPEDMLAVEQGSGGLQADPRDGNMIGIGLVRREDGSDLIQLDRVFLPDPKNRSVYDRMYTQFMAGKDRIRPVFHALNKM